MKAIPSRFNFMTAPVRTVRPGLIKSAFGVTVSSFLALAREQSESIRPLYPA
jgi:hypothetical protein